MTTKRTAFDERRDQAIANEASGTYRPLMCLANNCPRLWSSDFGTRLCSAHAASPEARDWPAVTQRLLDEDADRAMRDHYGDGRKQPNFPANPFDKRAALAALATLGRSSGHGKSWATRLQAREKAGERLTQAQREAWRAALKHEPRAEADL